MRTPRAMPRHQKRLSSAEHAPMAYPHGVLLPNTLTAQRSFPRQSRFLVRGFTLLELIFVLSVVLFLLSIVFALVADARLDARDKRRIEDLRQLERALQLYANDHGTFPLESEGANGNTATNDTFRALIDPYLSGIPADPIGIGDDTFYYYYDGAHYCGKEEYAVIFARQMDKPENANYEQFFSTTCSGVLDGEGRGGGEESYNIRLTGA